MSEHTKEPWELWESGDASPHQIFTRAELDQIEIHHYGFTDPDGSIAAEQLANARRIVACVNACRGLPTKELEGKGLVSAVGSELLERDQQLATLTARLSESEQREREAVGKLHEMNRLCEYNEKTVLEACEKWEQCETERDEAVAYAERLKAALTQCTEYRIGHPFYEQIVRITPPQALSSLRQQHMEEAANVCDAIQRKHEDAAKREDDVEERAFREGESCGAEDCGEAIRRLAQGEGKGEEG
jgi:hypothetical protein